MNSSAQCLAARIDPRQRGKPHIPLTGPRPQRAHLLHLNRRKPEQNRLNTAASTILFRHVHYLFHMLVPMPTPHVDVA